jgi:hypothetical protein
MLGSANLPQNVELPSGAIVAVPACFLTLRPWIGTPIGNTYGNKAVIESDGQPLFAELAVLQQLRLKGFDGVWVDSYRRTFRRGMPPLNVRCQSASRPPTRTLSDESGKEEDAGTYLRGRVGAFCL